jgi:arginyl-tRNA synthetase
MSIFKFYKKKFISSLASHGFELTEFNEKLSVDIPKQEKFGDISFNVPLVIASSLKKNPIIVAQQVVDIFLKEFTEFKSIEVAKPGFINFKFNNNFWFDYLLHISDEKDLLKDNSKKVNIEYVSANPTGPLHVGHCRGAVYGDTLANLLDYVGNFVTKEYYINDYGNQIHMFSKSVYARILEIQKSIKFDATSGLYPGEYIKDIAKSIIKKKLITSFEDYDQIKDDLGKFAMQEAMVMIKNDLLSLGIKHDLFVSETELVNKNNVKKAIKILEDKNYIYTGVLPKPKGDENEDWEPRDQLLFKSTLFGDDVDRALKKSDDTWTYFANDVAYHLYKLEREYDQYINILGADHAGYLKRLDACVTALSKEKVNFVCKVCQLVKLYKSGEPFKMSKRAGDFITAKELVDAVGKDAVRFMMIYRSNDSQLDFDFDLVTEKSKENPVFYVQYATARINSILRKVKIDTKTITKDDLNLLDTSYELEIIKKLSVWPKCLELSAVNLEPHRIPYYLYELSSMFHSYWNLGKENNNFKIVDNPNLNLVKARVFLINKILLILKSGLSILNVSAPESM